MADQSIIQRVLVAAKYALTGTPPDNWFGPLDPLQPQAPENVAGRQFDYPVGINLNFTPRGTEPVGFDKLKALAKNSNILRTVIETQKDKLEAQDWVIKPRQQPGGKRGVVGKDALAIQRMLERPDQIHDWSQWLRMLLDQLFVLDALSVYRRKDRGGAPYSFEIIDGATIKPLLDYSGRQPAVGPAYQQVLKGVPAVDYTAAELLYYPQNVRPDHAYGYSRVEQIVDTIETSIERVKSQKAFFTHGNLSDGFFEAPAGVQPDQVRQVEQMWNNLLGQGAVENRRFNQFLPSGFKWNAIGQPPLQDSFDEWLARVICFTFSTSPQPFMKQAGMGKGSAENEHLAAEAAGLANIMAYVRRVMNRIIAEDFQRTDLEFDWVEDREFDPKAKADIEDMRLKNGSLTIDEVRDRNGEEPLPDGAGAKAMVYTAAGPVIVEEVVNPPEPEPEPEPMVSPPVTASGDGKQSEMPGEVPTLGKAATPEQRLAGVLARYLAAKGAAIGKQLGSALWLAKVDPSSDDQSHRIEEALDEVDWDWSDLPGLVQPGIARIATAAGHDAVSGLGLFDPDVLKRMTANATAYAEQRAAEMVGRKLVDGEPVDNPGWSIPSATRDMIRSAVASAMEEGASNDELAAKVRACDAFGKTRAITIARTETAKAESQGTVAGWKASGLVAGKQWSAAPDCCDECQELDGEIVPIDGEFEGGADVPLHPNCRCNLTAVLPEEMPDDDLTKYSDDQPREDNGQFASGGGGSESSAGQSDGGQEASLSNSDIAAVQDYTGGGYKAMNEGLRIKTGVP